MSDSERSLRRLLDSNLVGIVSSDANGRIREANDAFARMVGEDARRIAELSLADVTAPDHRHVDAAALAQARMFGPVRPWEKAFVRKDGGRVTALVGVDFQPPDNYLWLILDISDRRRLQEQVRRSQKMEAVGRLAGGIAHDFNNLLCVITGHIDLLLHRLGEDDPLARNAMEALHAADKAALLVRQLMLFGRRQPSDPAAADLNAVITNLIPLLRRLTGAPIELVTRLEPGLAAVWADSGQLEQVLMNLAVNARDAMPEMGVLTIATASAGRVERRLQPRNPPGQPREHVRLTVSDTGCGMDKETLAQIFEPFFTTKGPDKGTGLGLATVHTVITQSGGMIHVESEPGKGTTFEILLPTTDAEPAGIADAREQATAYPRGSETVLVVEDDDLLRDLLGATLEDHGYQVLVASDHEQALKVVETRQGAVDVVLVDVVLPRASGPELCRMLNARYPGLKTIYMSGHVDEGFIAEVCRAGASFLPKPFGPAVLLERIRAVADGQHV